MAIANWWGVTNNTATAEKPKVYRWNGSQFVAIQEFNHATYSWEHFNVDQHDFLLSMRSFEPVRLYRWKEDMFELHQMFPSGPSINDGLFFDSGNNKYMVVLSYGYENGSYQTYSKVYKFE